MASRPSSASPRPRHTGTVTFYNWEHGYGFLERDDNSDAVYFHCSNIISYELTKMSASVAVGERVEFMLVKNRRGLRAVNITGLNGAPVKGSPNIPDLSEEEMRINNSTVYTEGESMLGPSRVGDPWAVDKETAERMKKAKEFAAKVDEYDNLCMKDIVFTTSLYPATRRTVDRTDVDKDKVKDEQEDDKDVEKKPKQI